MLAIIAAFRAFGPFTNFPPGKTVKTHESCRNKELHENAPTLRFFPLTLEETWRPSSVFSLEPRLRDRWNNYLRLLWDLQRFTNFRQLKIASENIDMYKWYLSKITPSRLPDIKRLQSHLAGHVWVSHSFVISSGLFSSQNWSPTADSSSSRTQTAVITSIPGNINRERICVTSFFEIVFHIMSNWILELNISCTRPLSGHRGP